MNFSIGLFSDLDLQQRPNNTGRGPCDHANQLARLLIRYNWHRTDIAVTQDCRNGLCAVVRYTAGWILAHHFSDLHLCLRPYEVLWPTLN